MARAILTLLITIVILTGFPSITLSQTHAGAITGKILDEEGNPLPESFIYLTSPAMLGMRRYITSDTGNFIFPGLPPGYYEIMAEKPEYKSVRIDRIIVNVGKTIQLSIVLESSLSEEKITREIPSPTLDITSAKTSMIMDIDLLKHIPFPRNLSDILGSMPGAFTERADFQKRLFIHGQTEKANTIVLDGIIVNDPSDQQPFFTLNIDTIEEIEFETAAHPVETGQTSGGFINLIQETGG
ncbi:MAG: carboxypeptidase regulatory-like domain-containing protein, partial [Candidatus Aminicenantes bacterium]|nr:carboxypeptidase regulatory-like domain-containing protein [Candidatus Aminicenantes bacterium]